jgi:hypothetical protein
MRKFGLGDKVIYKGSRLIVCGFIDRSLSVGFTTYRLSQSDGLPSLLEAYEHELTRDIATEAKLRRKPIIAPVVQPITMGEAYKELSFENINLKNKIITVQSRSLQLLNRIEQLKATIRRANPVKEPVAPVLYMIGRRVIYSGVICTVCRPPGDQKLDTGQFAGVWIFDPSVEYERCVSKDNIKPLPNGQL